MKIHGTGFSDGRSRGKAFIIRRGEAATLEGGKYDVIAEYKLFEDASKSVAADLHALSLGRAPGQDPSIDDQVFAAQEEIALDPELADSVRRYLAMGSYSAASAVNWACNDFCVQLGSLDDPYLKERAADVKDVCGLIVSKITGGDKSVTMDSIKEPVIVFASELLPSDFAGVDYSKILGFVTCKGGPTAHTSIIARSKRIPAIGGITEEELKSVNAGDEVLMEARTGDILVRPSDEEVEAFTGKIAAMVASIHKAALSPLASERDGNHEKGTIPARYLDNFANASSVEDVKARIAEGAGGIGLFRTEFLFLRSAGFPSEDAQCQTYNEAAEACKGKPLTIRTLDIGGDKQLPYYRIPSEQNPFLGMRGIRLSLGPMKDCFKTQVRAILRAYVNHRNIKMMYPMVTSPDEVVAADRILRECALELVSEGYTMPGPIDVGCMIETPAAVMRADELAAIVEFFSIGTNDLTQFLMAADRNNPAVSYIYNGDTTALQNALDLVYAAAERHGIPCRICGEVRPLVKEG
jgi:phosphotransferase system enzyme I (PtsI)